MDKCELFVVGFLLFFIITTAVLFLLGIIVPGRAVDKRDQGRADEHDRTSLDRDGWRNLCLSVMEANRKLSETNKEACRTISGMKEEEKRESPQ